MLIRLLKEEDKENWIRLAKELEDIFDAPNMSIDPQFHKHINNKIKKHEAIVAIDRMSERCLGIISFSKTDNCIAWFGVFEKYRKKGIGAKLLKCALNQLNRGKDIKVDTFLKDSKKGISAWKIYSKFGFVEGQRFFDEHKNERCQMIIPKSNNKKGESFHFNIDRYIKWADKENCPVCLKQTPQIKPTLIKELSYSWVECYNEAQGRLFGKCHVLSKVHSEHFYDMDHQDMVNFITDVQNTAKVLHQITGAVKINYEIHSNSMPHLHVHLFPRYLDDDYPSAPIDYRVSQPSPYESQEEYEWFVSSMRNLL
ncbi:GNAT family N-acetyltransferase [Clostridiaceae bacterium M8S5]|nr:GNAT family N-acetyltransferase [Clostridiaceae bacterium M8S5]